MFSFAPPLIEWYGFLPMIIVAFTGILALIMNMAKNPRRDSIALLTGGGLLIATLIVFQQIRSGSVELMNGMLLVDRVTVLGHLLILISSMLVVGFSDGYLKAKNINFGEFYALLCWAALGGMVMCASKNFCAIFLGIEMLSIAMYVMAGMNKGEQRSEESALKYFLLGAFASGFLLYGIAFFYGATGSLNMEVLMMRTLNASPDEAMLASIGLTLIVIGLSFKNSYVPFHQWTPDVYEGAPTNVTAFMSTVGKIGGFLVLFRVLAFAVGYKSILLPVMAVICVLTMTVGNILALRQTNVKRILGYSSIANAGYVLLAILSHMSDAAKAEFSPIAYYLFSYIFMTIGAFAVVTLGAKAGADDTDLSSLKGLSRRSPLAAAALAIFVLAQIGVPPLPGFFAKLGIFNSAIGADLTWLGIAMAINSAISVFYYYPILANAYTSDETDHERPLAPALAGTFSVCVAAMMSMVFFYNAFVNVFRVK